MEIITGQPVNFQNDLCGCPKGADVIHVDDRLSFQVRGTELYENRVLNGDFVTDLTDWTDSGSSWSQDSGFARGIGGSVLSQDVGIENGKSYVIRFTVQLEYFNPDDPFVVLLNASDEYVIYTSGRQEIRFTATSDFDLRFRSMVSYYAMITDIELFLLDTERIVAVVNTEGGYGSSLTATSVAGNRIFQNVEPPEGEKCFSICVGTQSDQFLTNNEFEAETGWTVDEGTALSYDLSEGTFTFQFDDTDPEPEDPHPIKLSQTFEGKAGCVIQTAAGFGSDAFTFVLGAELDSGSVGMFLTITIKDSQGNVINTRTYINITIFAPSSIVYNTATFSDGGFVILPYDDIYTYEITYGYQFGTVPGAISMSTKGLWITCYCEHQSQQYNIITDKCDTVGLRFSDVKPKMNFRFFEPPTDPFVFFHRIEGIIRPSTVSYEVAESMQFNGINYRSNSKSTYMKQVRSGAIGIHNIEMLARMLVLKSIEMEQYGNGEYVPVSYAESDLEFSTQDDNCLTQVVIKYKELPQNTLSRNCNY